MKMFSKLALLLLIAGFISHSIPAFAQQTGLSGVVKDVQGGAIPGAKVEVKEAGGASFHATTNSQGSYVIPNVERPITPLRPLRQVLPQSRRKCSCW